MSEAKIKKMIAETFLEVADALETGRYGKKAVIGFACEGSEHGQENIDRAFELAVRKGLTPYMIEGEDIHKKMEELLESGEIDAAVTMHYPFPVGVSTVGKIITPGMGKAMYLATTTGTSDTDRVSAMVKNATTVSSQPRQTESRTRPLVLPTLTAQDRQRSTCFS